VPQRVQPAVLCSSPRVDHAGCDLSRTVGAMNDFHPMVRIAASVGEGEIEVALGAGQFPLSQRVDEQRWQRDHAFGRRRLGAADLLVPIGALPDMEDRALEVDVLPPQAAQFARA
jgi:hypothetical protein